MFLINNRVSGNYFCETEAKVSIVKWSDNSVVTVISNNCLIDTIA